MKKIRVTVKTETSYDVCFDENIIDDNIISNYQEFISDEVKDQPDEFRHDTEFDEADYPFFNLSKEIAHNVANNDNYNVDCLPRIENAVYKRNENTGIKIQYVDSQQEYDFDLNECSL